MLDLFKWFGMLTTFKLLTENSDMSICETLSI